MSTTLINSSHSCSHPTTNPWDVNLHQEPAMSTLNLLALKSADSNQFHQIQWTRLQCFHRGNTQFDYTFMISVSISMNRTVVQLPTLIIELHQNQWTPQQYFERGNTIQYNFLLSSLGFTGLRAAKLAPETSTAAILTGCRHCHWWWCDDHHHV